MAEAENVGYKRSKRGEKIAPNDLFDEEIAPTFLDRNKIIAKYDERIQILENLKIELTKELKVLQEKNGDTNQKKITKTNEDIQGCQLQLDNLKNDKKDVTSFIGDYYAKDSKDQWRIKPNYWERTDQTLLAEFTVGRLQDYKSIDVLVRHKETLKILDAIRTEVTW